MISPSNAHAMIWLRHQDAKHLWVVVALASIGLHGLLLWLSLSLLLRTQPSARVIDETIVPVELIADPNPASPTADDGSATSESQPQSPEPQTAPLHQNTADASSTQSEVSELEQSGSAANPQPITSSGSPLGQPNPNESQRDQGNPSAPPNNDSPDPRGSTDPPSQITGDTGQSSNPEPIGGASTSDNPAVLVHLTPGGIPPNEADIPNQFPTLLDPSPRRIGLAPGTAICTLTNLGVITQYSQSELTVALRLTVEANGQVSAVRVFETSESLAFDEFARCLVQEQNLQFNPAQDGGQPVPTTMMILNVSLSPE